MRKILAVVSHPDDEILGCGATLYSCRRAGADVRVVFLGEGSTCRFGGNEIGSERALEEMRERAAYALDALAIIKINEYRFYDLPCGRFDQVPIIDIGKIVEAEIKTFKPDVILTHSAIDIHNDHLRTHQAVLQATRPTNPDLLVSEVLTFETPSSTEWRFTAAFAPTMFIPVDEQAMEAKISALEAYFSEVRDFPFPRSREGILTMAKFRGMQVGARYAEAFQPVRVIRPVADLLE
jgi:LmbE family N-acetylglucosaminyl deacetylase